MLAKVARKPGPGTFVPARALIQASVLRASMIGYWVSADFRPEQYRTTISNAWRDNSSL